MSTPAHDPAGPEAPALISHEEFQRTSGYAELCAEFGVDPAASWAEASMTVEEACEFLGEYEQMRRACSGWAAEHVAAYFEGLALRHDGDPGAVVLIDRYGRTLLVQDPLGECWELTAEKASPGRVGQALAGARIAATPPN